MSIDIFEYKEDSDGYILGTNTSTYQNAFKSGIDPKQFKSIIIPSHFNNKPIIAIGKYSFHRCETIEEVYIRANISVIYEYAFMGCYRLRYINIPSSCHTLCTACIDCRYFNIPNHIYNNGTLTIVFEPGSKLKQMESTAIYNAAHFELYIYDKLNPTYNLILGSDLPSTVKIYSPFSYKFCGYHTILFQQPTIHQKVIPIFHVYFFIILIS